VLITSTDDSLFFIDASNFDVDDIKDYTVKWSIFPEIPDASKRQILSYGKLMMIEKGAYARNTDYIVELIVTHTKLEKASDRKTVAFSVKSPPSPGSVRIDPSVGRIGEEFTIKLQDWKSENLPITYDVFNTYDATGSRKGL
jgi:hypothetical protein